MKKKKFIVFALAVAFLFALAAFVACSADTKYNEVSDGKDYTYDNSEFDPDLVQPDEGVTLDGVLDEAMYQSQRWLHAVKVDKNEIDPAYDYDAAVEMIESAAQMDMVVAFGEKGFYVGFDVQEAPGNSVWVNLDRASYLNSCIELYMAAEGTTGLYEDDTFEIDMMPSGDMVFKKADGVEQGGGGKGWVEITAPYDTMPRLAATTKGGEINTTACNGYTLELFVPYNFLEKYGYDTEGLKAGTSELYLNPVNITSYNYDGNDMNNDRWWFSTASQLDGDGWTNPSEWYHFNHGGLVGYDIGITQNGDTAGGSVMEYLGYDFAVADNTVTFLINEAEGYALKSLSVNGSSVLGDVVYDDEGRAQYVTLGKVRGDLDVEVEFVPYSAGTAAQVSVKEGYTHGTVSLDKDSYVVGDSVTLTLTPEEGYVVSDVLANGDSIFGIGLVTEDGGKTFTLTTRCVETPLEFEVVFAEATDVDGLQFTFILGDVDGMSVRLRNAAGDIYESTVSGATATFNGIPAGLYTLDVSITNYWLAVDEYFVSTAVEHEVNLSEFLPNGIYHQGDFTDLPAQSTSYYYRTVNSNISEEAWFAMKIAVDPEGAPRGQKYRIGYRMYVNGVECGPTLMWYTKYNSFRFSQCGLNWTEVDIPSEYNDAVWQRNGENGMYMIVHFDPSAGTMGVYLALSDKSELYHLVDLQHDSFKGGTITQFGAGVWVQGNSYCPAEIHDLRYGTSLSDCLGFDADDTITVNNPAVTGGLIALGKSSYVRGETVVLDIQPEEGYVLSALTVNGKDVFSEVSDNRLEFYLIDAELNIAATFEGYTPVSFTADVAAWKAGSEVDLTGATVTLSSSQIAYEGIEVSGGQISAEVRAGTYTASLSLDNYLTATVVVGDDGQVDEIVFEYDLFSVVQGAESNWDLTNQNHGSFTLNAVPNYSGISMNDSVNNFVFEINFTSVKTSTNVTRNEVRLLFDDGVRIGIDILSDGTGAKIESSDTSNGATTPAGDSTSMYPWARWYTLTTEEVKKYNSEEGILFKVVRLDDMVYVYLDGVLRAEKKLELSGKNYGSEPCYVGVYRWDGGLQKEYNYTFYTADTEASVTVKDGYTNGTVTLDQPSYNVTDTVTVSFEPAEGYILQSVSVNGQDMTGQVSENTLTFICTEPAYEIEVSFIAMSEVSVTADVTAWRAGSEVSLADATVSLSNSITSYQDIAIEGGKIAAEVIPGTYTATLSLDGYLSATVVVGESGGALDEIVFEYNLFTVASGSNWDLSEQNRGEITLNNGGYGGITMTDNLNDFTFEVNFTGAKAEGQTNEVRNEIRLAFSNGKYLALDLLYSNGAGIVQTPTWGDGYLYASWDAKYTMTAEESEKYLSADGILFKVIRRGNVVCLYLDGKFVLDFDISECAGTTATLSLYHWDGGQTVHYDYTFSAQPTAADISIKEGYTNGTAVLGQDSYSVGDLVILTLTPETGYVVGDVLVNGSSVLSSLTTEDGETYTVSYLCTSSPVEFEVTFVAQTDVDVLVNFAESNNADGMSVRLTQAGGQAYTAAVSNNAAAFEGLPAGFYTIEANIANYWLNAGTVYVYASMTAPTIDLSSYFEGGNVFFSGNFDNLPTQPEDTKADPYMEHYNAVNTTVEGDAWFAGKIMIAPDANLAATNYGVGYRFMIGGEEYNLMLVWKNGDKSFYLRLCRGGAIGGDAEAILLPSEYNSLINADDESGLTAEQLTGLYLVVYYDRAAGVFSVYVTMSDKTEIYHLADIEANGGDITQFGTALWIKKKVVATTTISEFRYGASLAEALGFDDGDTVTVTNPTVENGAIVLNQESYVRGDFVTLSVQPADGYVLSALTVNGKDVFSQIAYNRLAFYLTDAELNVAATFTAGTKVSVSADVAAWKAGNAADLTGETVSLVSNAITYDLAIESGKLTAEVIQGTYTAILSLPGYKSQQVTIGAEGLAALTFEYDLFSVVQGSESNWDLTNQNHGSFTLNAVPNYSGISMNDSVNNFVFEINFTSVKTGTNVTRNEVRLLFDDGVRIGIDIISDGTGAKIESSDTSDGATTPAGDSTSMYPWARWYVLTTEEVAKYNSEEGILFKVVRLDDMVYVYLDGVLRAERKLELSGKNYGSEPCYIGVYRWDGGLQKEYNYTFSEDPADIEAALQGTAA